MFLEILYYITSGLVCGYAFLFGARDERLCALIVILGSLLTTVVVEIFHYNWRLVGPYLFMVDLIVLIALVALALKSDRFWPLYAAAFQMPSVVTHIAMIVDPHIVPKSYAIAEGFWAYPMLIALAIGTRGYHYARKSRLNRLV